MLAPSLVADAPIFDPFDRTLRADPYPLYRELRAAAPAGRIPGFDIWYFARYADCQAVLRDRRGSCDTRKSDVYRKLAESLRLPVDIREQRSFLYLDPPDHTRLRGLVSGVFTQHRINALRQRIEDIVASLLDAAQRRRSLDVVADLAYPLSFTIICELLGLSIDGQGRFRAWSDELVAAMDPQMNPSPEVVERQVSVMREATQYLAEFIAERRRDPGDDLLSALFAAEQDGDKLTEGELLSTVILLFAAGQETTVNLISNGMLALLRHPEQLECLRGDLRLVRQAVEEILRWDAPTQLAQRIATEDMIVGGTAVRKGAPMILILGSANRDEALLPDSEDFDILRPHSPHMAFGVGPHFCLGAALARLEGEIALSRLVARFPALRLLEVQRRDTLVLRGLSALHVEI